MTPLTPDPSTWRVLVIDDRPATLKLVEAILQPAGATVLMIEDPQHGIELMGRLDVNILLLDIAMPSLSGWDVQRRLRSQRQFDQVPIIAFTALVMQSDRQRAQEAGFDGFITKPFHVDSLVQEIQASVQHFLERNQADQPGASGSG